MRVGARLDGLDGSVLLAGDEQAVRTPSTIKLTTRLGSPRLSIAIPFVQRKEGLAAVRLLVVGLDIHR